MSSRVITEVYSKLLFGDFARIKKEFMPVIEVKTGKKVNVRDLVFQVREATRGINDPMERLDAVIDNIPVADNGIIYESTGSLHERHAFRESLGEEILGQSQDAGLWRIFYTFYQTLEVQEISDQMLPSWLMKDPSPQEPAKEVTAFPETPLQPGSLQPAA